MDPVNNHLDTVRAENLNNNAILIDWCSSIYGIFWGVWLGFFVEQIFMNEINPSYSYFSPIISFGFPVLILYYSLYFVRWLWAMRSLQNFDELEGRLDRAIFGLIEFILGLLLLGFLYNIDLIWVLMGIWSSASWIILVFLLVIWDRRF